MYRRKSGIQRSACGCYILVTPRRGVREGFDVDIGRLPHRCVFQNSIKQLQGESVFRTLPVRPRDCERFSVL